MRKSMLVSVFGVALVAALAAFALRGGGTASADNLGPCNDGSSPVGSVANGATGMNYAMHHIAFLAKIGGLGHDGHIPGDHQGFSFCDPGGAHVNGGGVSPATLAGAGWACQNVPGLGVHCFPPGFMASSSTIPVLVFDTSDPESTDAPFLGTELLIHVDLYNGQPCPQDDLEHYEDLSGEGLPYFACHHYDTSH